MTNLIDIARALTDKRLLGAALGEIATWSTWVAVLKATFGLPLTAEELAVFENVAGGRAPPNKRVRELWAVIGRRGGKSRIAAALACFLALFVKYKLAAGERGMILVLASSVEQAKVVFNYAKAFLAESPILTKEIEETTANEIRLKNGVVIAIHSNSFKTIRGRTLLAAIFDEVSFWRDETSSQPDTETYTSVLPALATTNGMLIGISTPYRKLGLLYQKHRSCFGQDDPDILVVQGSSRTFNVSDDLSDAVIAAQHAADPTGSSSEWDAEFRADLSAFLDEATIEASIDYARPLELPPHSEQIYYGFVDASGGRHDAYTVAIGHRHEGRFIIDAVRGHTAPFDPGAVTAEFAVLAKQYHLNSVRGDYYSAGWVEGAWREHGIRYERSDKSKSEIYLEVLPVFTRGLTSLPNHPQLLKELRLLERRTHVSGRDTISHGRTGSDDFANAVAGALLLANSGGSSLWLGEALLVDGAAAPLPRRVDFIFATLVADKLGRAGVAYFSADGLSRVGSEIYLLDCEQGSLSPSLLHGIVARLAQLTETCLARTGAVVFTTSELSEALERMGYRSEIIDRVTRDAMLGIAAAIHVTAGRVRVCADVLAKGYPLTFLQGAAVSQDDDDPLRLSFLAGIAVALDTGRSLGRAAA
jgi:hypothetical protein